MKERPVNRVVERALERCTLDLTRRKPYVVNPEVDGSRVVSNTLYSLCLTGDFVTQPASSHCAPVHILHSHPVSLLSLCTSTHPSQSPSLPPLTAHMSGRIRMASRDLRAASSSISMRTLRASNTLHTCQGGLGVRVSDSKVL